MIVCPLCEHQQNQGAVCEVCGRVLVASQPPDIGSERLAELESTALTGAPVNVVVERMVDIDEHRAAAVQASSLESVPEFECTRLPDAGQALPSEPISELEPTRFADDGQRTQLSANRTCRYCGNVQQGGVLCERCGLRLPGVEFQRAAAKKGSGEPEPIPCPACSVKGHYGTRCRACGAFIRHPEV